MDNVSSKKTAGALVERIPEAIRGVHLLVAGETGIDEYVWGEIRRISPEAPVPVVEVRSRNLKLGMAANVAQNIARLGGKVSLVTVRGQDEDGTSIERLLTQEGIENVSFVEDVTRPTLRKTRVIAQKQHVVRIDQEKSHRLTDAPAKAFSDRILERLDGVQGVVLQDYGKGLWHEGTVGFLKVAKERGIPVFVDPSRYSSVGIYRGATLMTPNLEEAEMLAGVRHESLSSPVIQDARLDRIVRTLADRADLEHSIVTCGAQGMVCLSQGDQQMSHIPTFAREVFDVTGAGDTVISVLGMMMAAGFEIAVSMRVANAAAGVVVGKVGTASVSPEELVRELRRPELSLSSA